MYVYGVSNMELSVKNEPKDKLSTTHFIKNLDLKC